MTPHEALAVVTGCPRTTTPDTELRAREVLRELVERAGSGVCPLAVGDVLVGFCGGAFGRDSFGHKVVEAIGKDWVVAREDSGQAVFCSTGPESLVEYRGS